VVGHLDADLVLTALDEDVEVGGGVPDGIGRELRRHDGDVVDELCR
jgi:hypothetical protein